MAALPEQVDTAGVEKAPQTPINTRPMDLASEKIVRPGLNSTRGAGDAMPRILWMPLTTMPQTDSDGNYDND